jgi:hypothetical protein
MPPRRDRRLAASTIPLGERRLRHRRASAAMITGWSASPPIHWESDNMTRHEELLGRRTSSTPINSEFVERLEGQVERRASGQIRDLHIVCVDDRIILQGRSRTYHAKQLAQQAVLDFADGFLVVANQIEVY